MNVPEWTKYRRVDEVVECFPIRKETERELLELMPDAYCGEPPGEDDWPEPDAKRDEPYKLSKVWGKLSKEAMEDLMRAHGKESEDG